MKNYLDTDGAFLVRNRDQVDTYALSIVKDYEVG
jgi:hypothetical protein